MCKGQGKPLMQRRCGQIAQAVVKLLQPRFAAARKPLRTTATTNNDDKSKDNQNEKKDPKTPIQQRQQQPGGAGGGGGGIQDKWLLQILLLTPTVAATCLTQCQRHGTATATAATTTTTTTWPNWYLPAGMAYVEMPKDDGIIPSSAYRKLLEAFWCMGRIPARGSSVAVDLGASPGGWTAILSHHCQCRAVAAVDRSPLAPHLMKKDNVNYVRGDAFAFDPTQLYSDLCVPSPSSAQDTWMVSDVIAYPDKIHKLLDRWCGHRWAQHVVVTIKFQNKSNKNTADDDDDNNNNNNNFQAIDTAVSICRSHGYSNLRVKHFFNNKNEVTLMASFQHDDGGQQQQPPPPPPQEKQQNEHGDDGVVEPTATKSFYPRTLPVSPS